MSPVFVKAESKGATDATWLKAWQLVDSHSRTGHEAVIFELRFNLPTEEVDRSDEIVRVSRQSSSGTYEFLREHVLNKKDFKLGSRDMNGSKEVVELIGNTKTAPATPQSAPGEPTTWFFASEGYIH